MCALGFNWHSKTSRRPKTNQTGKYQAVNQYEFPILYDMLKFWLLKVQVTRSQGNFLDKNHFNQEKIAKDFLALYDLYRPSISRQGSQVTVKDRSYIFTPLKDLKWKITSCQPVDTLTADTLTAVTAVMGEGASAVTVAVEEGNPKMNAFGDSVVPGAKTSTKKPRCEPKKKKKPSTVSKARPAAQESGSTNAGTRQGQATLESESVAASSAGAVGPIAPSPPAETAVAATLAETIMKTAHAHVAPRVAESLTDVDDAIQQRIRNLEEKISKQAKDLVVANTRAVKEREEKLELETRLKSKDAEIQEVMEEGEMLSKKQLAMETSMKQMKAQLAKAQRDLSERDSSLQAESQRGEEEASSKADYQAKLDSMRSEHEETVKVLRAELIATEPITTAANRFAGSTFRELRSAAGTVQAGLLTLFHAAVAGEQIVVAQRVERFAVELD